MEYILLVAAVVAIIAAEWLLVPRRYAYALAVVLLIAAAVYLWLVKPVH
jgi:hypothetical protein